jgi:hypothetical protein
MITSVTVQDIETGRRRTIRLQHGTHGHWAVNPIRREGAGWCIQWAYRLGLGTKYDKPLPEHTGFRTKREAQAVKAALVAAGRTGW